MSPPRAVVQGKFTQAPSVTPQFGTCLPRTEGETRALPALQPACMWRSDVVGRTRLGPPGSWLHLPPLHTPSCGALNISNAWRPHFSIYQMVVSDFISKCSRNLTGTSQAKGGMRSSQEGNDQHQRSSFPFYLVSYVRF